MSKALLQAYRQHGFAPLPLRPNEKLPLAGSELEFGRYPVVPDDCNVGLFAGSTNGFVVIDADDERSRENVTARLKGLGLYDWITIVRTPKRGGLHFWLRMVDKPAGAQAYYKLSAAVGGGEFRVNKPAYVVAPGSVITEGKYTFVQGSVGGFKEQPAVEWKDMLWLAPDRMGVAGSTARHVAKDAPLPLPSWIRATYSNPSALKLFCYLAQPDRQGRVQRIDYKTGAPIPGKFFDTRSEAEQAIVTGLVWAGWTFDKVKERFEQERAGHYMTVPDREHYLIVGYNKAIEFLNAMKKNKSS